MANTFTDFDAAVSSSLAFRGFVANSVGAQAAQLSWGRSGTSGVQIPTVSGAGVSDVSGLLGFSNRQSITATSQLLSFDKHKGSHFVIQTDEQSTSAIDLGAAYSERTGAQLAAQVDLDLFVEADTTSQENPTAGSLVAAADILDVYEQMNGNNVPLQERVWVLDPEAYSDVLGLDNFVRSDARGDGTSGSVTGQVGQLLGAPVLMSQNLPAAKSFYIYKPALALGINRDMESFIGRVPGNFGTTYELSIKYGVKLVDSGGVIEINNYEAKAIGAAGATPPTTRGEPNDPVANEKTKPR